MILHTSHILNQQSGDHKVSDRQNFYIYIYGFIYIYKYKCVHIEYCWLFFFQEGKHQTANFQHLSCIKMLSGKKPLDLILYFQFYVPIQLILQIQHRYEN